MHGQVSAAFQPLPARRELQTYRWLHGLRFCVGGGDGGLETLSLPDLSLMGRAKKTQATILGLSPSFDLIPN